MTRPRLTHVLEVIVLPQYQIPPYAYHQYSLILFIKLRWSMMVANIAAKDGLGGEVEEKIK